MTGSTQPDVPAVRSVTLVASLRADDSSSLLRLASALHTRNVDVVNASLQSDVEGLARFEVTVKADPARARLLALTLAGVIGVIEVGVSDAPMT